MEDFVGKARKLLLGMKDFHLFFLLFSKRYFDNSRQSNDIIECELFNEVKDYDDSQSPFHFIR